jgi:hypothetical protein
LPFAVCPQSCAEGLYAEGRGPPSVLVMYAKGQSYTDGHSVSAEGGLRRRATPTAALGVSYAERISLYADGWKRSAYEQIPVVLAGQWFDIKFVAHPPFRFTSSPPIFLGY